MAADDRLEDDSLARRLREAHRRVRMLPPADRERLARRYLAICDLAKRDPRRASTRLDAFLAEVADTPRAQENADGD
ncbi:hypothetical protein [Thermoactinospora rubra]|uniref:hypothetical protein n=1 Tax=Thermoactinospora rubra TaxID=1088767 RepID=UPI000A121FB3|nr:hypothetical protein [Thermoactinospora rubra]